MSTEENKTVESDSTETQARVIVSVSKDFIHATILLPKQLSDAEPVSEEEIRSELASEKVTYGLLDEIIADVAARGVVDETIEVALGEEGVPGDDAKLEFLFDTNPDHAPKTDEQGLIDYHDMNFVQGVTENQALVRKTPATEGVPGKGVNGESISAPDGKDVRLPKGPNTRESDDGLELISSANGAATFLDGKVTVRDVVTISGDVDYSTGNIHSPGSVAIKGDVKAGFKVCAEGDIEIFGSVEDSEVVSEGDILIKGGFNGRGDGLVKAAGSVTVQRVRNQRIVAGTDIFLGGNAQNANLQAGERIIVSAADASISGGEARAEKEILAPVLGSEVWSETILRVASDSHLKEEIKKIDEEVERLEEDQVRVAKALAGLMRLDLSNRLPEDKKAGLAKLREVSRGIPENIESLQAKKEEIKAQLVETEKARIYAKKTLHQGVKAFFGIVYLDVKAKRGPTELSCYSGRVIMDEFKPSAKTT